MKRRVFIYFMVMLVFVTGGILFLKSEKSNTKMESLGNEWIAVTTEVSKEIELSDADFGCSAVFQVEQNEDTGLYTISDAVSPFIWKKKAPPEYTFRPRDEAQIMCVEDGNCYTVQQDFWVHKSGKALALISVSVDFVLDREKGKIKTTAV